MYCNPKMKLNKFREVAIPRNREYFARLGQLEAHSSLYSDDGEQIPIQGNKVDVIAAQEAYEKAQLKKEAKSKSEDQE